MNFDLQKSLKVKNNSLKIDDQNLRSFFYQGLFCNFFNGFVTIITKIVSNFFSLNPFIKTLFKIFHAFDFKSQVIIVLDNFLLVFTCLTNNLCNSFSPKNLFKNLYFFLIFSVIFNFIESCIQKLMSIFLNSCIDWFPLKVFHSQTKNTGIIILLLTQLKIDIKLL